MYVSARQVHNLWFKEVAVVNNTLSLLWRIPSIFLRLQALKCIQCIQSVQAELIAKRLTKVNGHFYRKRSVIWRESRLGLVKVVPDGWMSKLLMISGSRVQYKEKDHFCFISRFRFRSVLWLDADGWMDRFIPYFIWGIPLGTNEALQAFHSFSFSVQITLKFGSWSV